MKPKTTLTLSETSLERAAILMVQDEAPSLTSFLEKLVREEWNRRQGISQGMVFRDATSAPQPLTTKGQPVNYRFKRRRAG